MADLTDLTVSLVPVADDVIAVETSVDIRALLVYGRDFTLLIDTLTRLADLDPVREEVARQGKPLLIANSHADWDHWWGNAAFPEAPVIAHRLTLERQRREGKRALTAKQKESPIHFADITLRPATIVFEGALTLDLGGLHVEISPLPGHVPDETVAYLPERRLLFAADAAEDPVPLLNSGPLLAWAQALEDWARRARVVVPAHGAVSGPGLLRRNAEYLRGLKSDPGRKVLELAEARSFYKGAHLRNLKRAASIE